LSDTDSSVRDLFNNIEKNELPDDEILEKLWEVQPMEMKRHDLGPKKGEMRSELIKSAADEAKKKQRKEQGVKEILEPYPGLLTVIILKEMATVATWILQTASNIIDSSVPYNSTIAKPTLTTLAICT